eukprot:6460576-Amphidinium_carterae.2
MSCVYFTPSCAFDNLCIAAAASCQTHRRYSVTRLATILQYVVRASMLSQKPKPTVNFSPIAHMLTDYRTPLPSKQHCYARESRIRGPWMRLLTELKKRYLYCERAAPTPPPANYFFLFEGDGLLLKLLSQ